MEKTTKEKTHIISRKADNFFITVNEIVSFIGRFFKELVTPPFEFREFIKQCYEVGVRSLPLISVTGFIIGLVFTRQSRPSLAEFGASSWLPALVSIAIIRAVGPLVTGLIAAGRVGSKIGAEIGSMKVSEQIDAMEVSATNPYKFLVVTRVLATTIMIPFLTMFTILVSLMGGFVDIHANEATSLKTFFEQVFEAIKFSDIFASLVRSVLFGFTIGMVGCYKGYHASKGTEGVGISANTTVVAAMFLIFIEEFMIIQVITALRNW